MLKPLDQDEIAIKLSKMANFVLADILKVGGLKISNNK